MESVRSFLTNLNAGRGAANKQESAGEGLSRQMEQMGGDYPERPTASGDTKMQTRYQHDLKRKDNDNYFYIMWHA